MVWKSNFNLRNYSTDISYIHYPAFFEYPAKFIGSESIDRREYYKIEVKLPRGAVLTYFIDSLTYLPMKVVGEFTMNGKEITPFRDLYNYQEVGGIYLPFGFTYGSRHGQIKGQVDSIEIDVKFDDDYFAIPDQQ